MGRAGGASLGCRRPPSTAADRDAVLPKTLAAIAFATLLCLVAACANATPSQSQPVPGTQVNLFAPTSVLASATVPALTPEQQYQILIGADSIRPLNLTLPASGYVRLEITDTGADCKFSVGNYVQALS